MTAVNHCTSRVIAKPHLKLMRLSGRLVGYMVYNSEGIFGARRFVRYHFLDVDAGTMPKRAASAEQAKIGGDL